MLQDFGLVEDESLVPAAIAGIVAIREANPVHTQVRHAIVRMDVQRKIAAGTRRDVHLDKERFPFVHRQAYRKFRL